MIQTRHVTNSQGPRPRLCRFQLQVRNGSTTATTFSEQPSEQRTDSFKPTTCCKSLAQSTLGQASQSPQTTSQFRVVCSARSRGIFNQMASITSNHKSSSSSNYYKTTMDVAARSNIQASAYSVDAVTGSLKGFHYSTHGAGGTSRALHIVDGILTRS